MKIHIPTKQEKEQEKTNLSKQNNIDENNNEVDLIKQYVTSSSGLNSISKEDENEKEMKVNINTATQTELETLPGIGPSTALKIITYRKEKGKFNKIEDIKEVSGIGDAKYEKIKEFISI